MRKRLFKVGVVFGLPVLKLYWFLFRPKAVGVKCAVWREGRVLLIRNSYGLRRWTLPGGGVKRNETLEKAAAREVKEEVGISLEKVRNCGSIYYDGEYKKNTIWVFSADTQSAEFKIDDLEIAEAGWFDPKTLPKAKSHLLIQFLEMVQRGLNK